MENMKRVVSLMLCIVMVFGLLPMTVFATDVDTTDEIFEEYFEEEVEVEAAVVGNENPVNPEDIIYEEEEIIEETAPVVENEDPVAPVAEGDISDSVTVPTGDKKKIYVLTSSVTAGKQYIIASGNTVGSVYALDTDTTGTSVTVKKDGDVIYIDAASLANNAVVWTANDGLKFQNASNNKYLGRDSSKLNFQDSSNNAANWTYSNNNLKTSTSRYLQCSTDGAWSVPSSYYNYPAVYFYEYQEITPSVTYSISAQDLEHTYSVDATTANVVVTHNIPEDKVTAIEYTYDNSDVIKSIKDGVITFAGKTGTAEVKVVYTFTAANGTKNIGTTFKVTVTKVGYNLGISHDGKVVTDSTIAVKKVTKGTAITLAPLVTLVANGTTSNVDLSQCTNIHWSIPEEYAVAEIDETSGVVTFTGDDGEFTVILNLTVGGENLSAQVHISATTTAYVVPGASTTDFPEYPDQGAIRFDKTAEVQGTSFSQTGMAQVELSMTGVPFKTHQTLDVVLMLDRSSSMGKSDNEYKTKRIASTIAAAQEFVKNVAKDANGNFTGNRIMVLDFLGGNLNQGDRYVYERNIYNTVDEVIFKPDYGTGDMELGYQVIDSDEELNTLLNNIATNFKSQTDYYGTEYAMGLRDCYEVLDAVKKDGNQQFCVFMSDGIPNYYQTTTTHYNTTSGLISALYSVQNATSANAVVKRGNNYAYEKYSTEMKKAGVTVFTVGLGLYGKNSSWNSSNSKEACEMVASIMLNDISGPAGETTQPDGKGTNTLSKKDSYFFSVSDTNAATDMKNVFTNIADKITQAATDVVVTDKINDNYTVIFDKVAGTQKDENGNPLVIDQGKLYIEVFNYELDEFHERKYNDDGTPDGTSVFKLYLKDSNDDTKGGTYSAAKDDKGTAYEKVKFETAAAGKKAYWTTVNADYVVKDNDIVINIDGTRYKFVEDGTGTMNVASGAYAYGTIDAVTNMSNNLVLITPYFAYSAETRMLAWTASELTDFNELALKYFVYLQDSATEVGHDGVEKEPGTYPTNDWAYITYTNFKGNDCRQEFPVPQMTWNGAQASYVFYLVNAEGKPINQSGQVVDFANAVFVTDVFTTAIVWNKGTGSESAGQADLDVDWLAKEKLPEGYTLYDTAAKFTLDVWEKANGETLRNQFTIGGGTKAQIYAHLNSIFDDLSVTEDKVSIETTKVYNTKAGTKYDDYGTYVNADNAGAGETALPHFDFANTTVAFAVVWEAKLNPDTVVVDFGLDVLIDVVANDQLKNAVNGIGWNNTGYGDVTMNTGIASGYKLNQFVKDGNTISIENENQVRFSQGNMEFNAPVTFYYESAVDFYQNGAPKSGYMYSSVTVIPATTIYYEDSFVTLKSYSKVGDKWEEITDGSGVWTREGQTINATQAQDRPGASKLSAALDADNVYGYDQVYDQCNMFSLGSAMKATVDSTHYGTMQFTFYGTGFDVISMASNKTGGIMVDVNKVNDDGSTTRVRGMTVDTYYGYKYVLCEVTYEQNEDGTWTEISRVEAEEDSGVVVGEELWEDMPTAPGQPENTDKKVTKKVYEKHWMPADTTDTETGIYQVPVIECAGLEYGKYTVTIKCTYGKFFDHGQYDEGKYDFYLDAIRIYDPMNDSAVVNGTDVYKADKEGWPIYEEIRNNLLDMVFDEGAVELPGALFLDGDENNWSVSDYLNYGPNNEVYLKGEQGVAFQLSDELFNGKKVASIQIGMKSADGVAVTVDVSATTLDDNVNSDGSNVTTRGITTLNTATGMYYDLAELLGLQGKALEEFDYNSLQGKIITIIGCDDNDGLVSLTDVKVTFTEEHQISEGLFYTNRNAIEKILETMNKTEQGEQTFTPGYLKIKDLKWSRAGNPIKVEVTTSTDVEAITVNGQLVTSYKAKNIDGIKRVWTTTVATSVKDSNQKEITVIAYKADGVASAAVTKTVEIPTNNGSNKAVVSDLISLIKNLLKP